jgi:prepilin-type N-terminal cleavage/methylation domain-containing protein
MMDRRRSLDRRAFTLIELIVVIVIMGLLATLAVLSTGGMMDRYQLSQAAETIEIFDARARRSAHSLRQPIRAIIQPNQRRLVIASPGGNTSRSVAAQFRLPRAVEIAEIRLRRRVTAAGNFEIDYNRQGSSPTYALRLQRGKMSRWLVVLGVSGQIVTLKNEGEVDEILSL